MHKHRESLSTEHCKRKGDEKASRLGRQVLTTAFEIHDAGLGSGTLNDVRGHQKASGRLFLKKHFKVVKVPLHLKKSFFEKHKL